MPGTCRPFGPAWIFQYAEICTSPVFAHLCGFLWTHPHVDKHAGLTAVKNFKNIFLK